MNVRSLPSGDPVPETLGSPGPHHLTQELLAAWRRSLESLDAPQESFAALDRLPDASVVVTGQQPGVWGGPLYSAYKAVTAVALARRREKETGKPCVPVFWMGADDTDHDEVAWGCLPNAEGKLFRHRWPAPPNARSWVGGRVLPFPTEAATFLRQPPPVWGSPDPDREFTLAEGFSRFLYRTLGSLGLLVLDARWPEVSGAGRDLWERYLTRHGDVSRAVERRGTELLAEDRPAPLAGQTDQGLFLIEDAARAECPPEEWESRARRALDAGRHMTPSVLLRAPLQDYLLGSCAQVVGRGEAAYLRQLDPAYALLEIHRPARVPRMHATVVPRGWVPPDAWHEALEDPESYVSEQVQGPGDAIEAMRRSWASQLKDLERAWSEDQAGTEAVRSGGKKIGYQIDRLEQQLERQARRSLYKRHPHLRHLPEFLKPRRGHQDRGVSAAALGLWWGERAGAVLITVADRHVAALSRGESKSWIMEVTDG